jgi:HSP20 family protein
MALSRREFEDLWPQPFETGLEWARHPLETWRRLLGEVKVEEYIEDGQLVIRAELPGVDPERDIDISVVEGHLRIRAERRQEHKVEERNYRRSEIRYGSYSRTLPLPPGASEDQIEATYKDGILEVRAPVAEPSTGRTKIPIQRS